MGDRRRSTRPCPLFLKARATVARDGDDYVTTLTLTGSPTAIVWGTCRAAPAPWRAPPSTPAGSAPDAATGGVRTPLAAGAEGVATITLRLPARAAPVTLAWRVERRGALAPVESVPVGMGAGSPARLGATLERPPPGATGSSVNFAVASRGAAAVGLVLARVPADAAAAPRGAPPPAASSCLEIDLPPASHRTGDVWHVRVDGLTDLGTLTWAWRATGPLGGGGAAFAPGRVLLDPYATAALRMTLPPGINVAPGLDGGAAGDGVACVGCLAPLAAAPAPPLPLAPPPALEATVVLDVDVRTFSDHESVPVEHRGTFLGVLDRLDAAGGAVERITALHLAAPLTLAGPGPLGPAPISLLAPDPELATRPGEPTAAPAELAALVAGAHARGLAVLFGVDLTFTGEPPGPAGVASLAGLDASIYYRPGSRVLNAGAPAVRALGLEAVRRLAADYGADGFLLAHAESLLQDEDGVVQDAPPLVDALAADPALARRALAAAAADPTLLPRDGARSFPHWGVLAERNWRLATLLARWLGQGEHGVAPAVAERAGGSADLVAPAWGDELPGSLAAGRRAAHVFNCCMLPGESTLAGAAAAALGGGGTEAERATLARSLLVACALFRGTPFIPASALDDPDGAALVGALLELRSAHAPALAPRAGADPPPLTWHAAFPGCEPDWEGARAGEWGADAAAFSVAHGGEGGVWAVYVGFNPHPGPVPLSLPEPPRGAAWARAIDTALVGPDGATPSGGVRLGGEYELGAKAALVLVAVAE